MSTRTKKTAPAVPPALATEVIHGEFMPIKAIDLLPWPDLNPRRRFDPERHAEMVGSVRARGIREPLLVDSVEVLLASAHEKTTRLRRRIVAGERRWRAAMEVGPDTLVPCLVKLYTVEEAIEVALIENLDRDDLTEVDEARGLRSLIDKTGTSQAKLAARINRSQAYVANRLRLLDLPENALELLEEGLIDVGAARDFLLPFTKIPDAARTKVFKAIVKEVRAHSGEKGFDGRSVLEIVSDAATKLSKSLNPHAWPENKRPLFDVKLHEKCGCNGPAFEYNEGYGRSKERRCFNAEWWNAQQQKAIEAEKKKKATAIEKIAAKAEVLNGRAVLDDQAFGRKFSYGDYETIARGRRPVIDEEGGMYRQRSVLDVSLLPAESLVFVKDLDSRREPSLVCTDPSAIQRAKAVVERERKELLAARRTERAVAERAELENPIEPWMLRTMMKTRPDTSVLLEVARDHGIELGKHGQVYEHLDSVSDADITRLFKAAALRSRQKGGRWGQDPLEEQVDQELVSKYLPLYMALLPPAPERAGLTPEQSAELDLLLNAIMPDDDFEYYDLYDEREEQELQSKLDAVDARIAELGYTPTADEARLIAGARRALKQSDQDDVSHTKDPADPECVVCGCSESAACEGGCSWIVVDRARGAGVCSSCAASKEEAEAQLTDAVAA